MRRASKAFFLSEADSSLLYQDVCTAREALQRADWGISAAKMQGRQCWRRFEIRCLCFYLTESQENNLLTDIAPYFSCLLYHMQLF